MQPTRTLADRLWSRVIEQPDGCWEWTGALTSTGYGNLVIGSRTDQSRRNVRAHRLAWELTHGAPPDGMLVCHRCDNRLCCNPDHLFLGTHSDNTADMDRKGRRVITPHAGTANGRAVLSPGKAQAIRRMVADGMTYAQIAASLGVSRSTVGKTARKQVWS